MNIESSVKLATPVTFRSWSGEHITATLTAIHYRAAGGQHYYTATLVIAPDMMLRVFNEQWFHLNDHVMQQEVQFDAAGDITLTLTLSPALAAQLGQQQWDADTLLKALLTPAANTTSLGMDSAELWFVIEAEQVIQLPDELREHGELKIGFFTIWKQELLHIAARSSTHDLNSNGSSLDAQADGAEQSGGIDSADGIDGTEQSGGIDSADDIDGTEQSGGIDSADGIDGTEAKAGLPTTGFSLGKQVEELLKERQLAYRWHNEHIIVLNVAGKHNTSWTELIRIEQAARLVILYAVFPLAIPEQLHKEIAQVLMNDNYDLMNGAFEMDSSDGELRFRSTLICPEQLHQACFNQLLADHEQIMEHYIPELNELLQ